MIRKKKIVQADISHFDTHAETSDASNKNYGL